jgi:hypothetical protein
MISGFLMKFMRLSIRLFNFSMIDIWKIVKEFIPLDFKSLKL